MKETKKIIVSVIVAVVVVGAVAYLVDWSGFSVVEPEPGPENGEVSNSEFQIIDLVEGTGAEATNGSFITVHYTGTLIDGTKFDSSLDRGTPFVFALGSGQVIKGWDLGVAGMKVGGKRKLVIPSELGYGDTGSGDLIVPGATLVFEVELLGVE